MATAANPDVYGYRWASSISGGVNAPTWAAAMNTALPVAIADLDSTIFYLYLGIENDGGMTANTLYDAQHDQGSGSYVTVPTSSSHVISVAGAGTPDETITVTTLVSNGFTAGIGSATDGRYRESLSADHFRYFGITAGNYSVACHAFQFTSSLSGGETVVFRFLDESAAVITNDVTPTATIASAGVTVSVENASFSWTEQNLFLDEALTTEGAAFNFTGQDLVVSFGAYQRDENASFSFVGEEDYISERLHLENALFSWTGQEDYISEGLTQEGAAFTFTGQDFTQSFGARQTDENASFSMTQQPGKVNEVLKPENATLSWTSQPVGFDEAVMIVHGGFNFEALGLRNVQEIKIAAAHLTFDEQTYLIKEAMHIEGAVFSFAGEDFVLVDTGGGVTPKRNPGRKISIRHSISIS